jgi:hypothetical protein
MATAESTVRRRESLTSGFANKHADNEFVQLMMQK